MNVGNYFRVSHDNRLIFDGRARFALTNPASDRKSGEVLKQQLARMFPQLDRVAVDYCWGGLVDMTQDRLPHAGEHNGIFYAMCYNGNGVQMSTQMGQIMARVIAGETDANPWRDRDWPAIPAHWGRSWFMPLVGAYYPHQGSHHLSTCASGWSGINHLHRIGVARRWRALIMGADAHHGA